MRSSPLRLSATIELRSVAGHPQSANNHTAQGVNNACTEDVRNDGTAAAGMPAGAGDRVFNETRFLQKRPDRLDKFRCEVRGELDLAQPVLATGFKRWFCANRRHPKRRRIRAAHAIEAGLAGNLKPPAISICALGRTSP